PRPRLPEPASPNRQPPPACPRPRLPACPRPPGPRSQWTCGAGNSNTMPSCDAPNRDTSGWDLPSWEIEPHSSNTGITRPGVLLGQLDLLERPLEVLDQV